MAEKEKEHSKEDIGIRRYISLEVKRHESGRKGLGLEESTGLRRRNRTKTRALG